jgi:hypothetical protein
MKACGLRVDPDGNLPGLQSLQRFSIPSTPEGLNSFHNCLAIKDGFGK